MGTRVVNKVSSRHFPWRPSLIQTPYRSAATQDEGAAPRRIRGKYFVFSKGEFFHNYPLARSAFVFGRGTNFRRQPVDIPLKALGQVNKSLLYTQTSFSGLDSSSSLFFPPLRLFQRSSSRLLAFIKITDRGAFVKKTRYLVLSWKRRAPRALLTFEPYLKGIFQDSNRPFRPVYPQDWYFSTGNGILSCLESDEYPITENTAEFSYDDFLPFFPLDPRPYETTINHLCRGYSRNLFRSFVARTVPPLFLPICLFFPFV